MSDQALETMLKIVLALFNIVLLPLLYGLLRPFIEDLVDRWRYRRTKAIRLRGRYSDNGGYVYNMTAFLYLARCEHMDDDYEVKGLIESELIEFPKDFAQNNPRYPAGSIGFEVVAGRCDRHFVLRLTTAAITNRALVSRCAYHITISNDHSTFTSALTILENGGTATWSGTAQVR